MAYRIQLTRYAVQNVDWVYFGAYRMRVEVTAVEGEDLDTRIFVYHHHPDSAYEGSTLCDRFAAVAGPAQLADIPPLAPDPEHGWPFFRLAYVELDFDSQQQADDVWRIIQDEAMRLCEAMERYRNLAVAEEVWVPSPPADSPDSESVSTSV